MCCDLNYKKVYNKVHVFLLLARLLRAEERHEKKAFPFFILVPVPVPCNHKVKTIKKSLKYVFCRRRNGGPPPTTVFVYSGGKCKGHSC